MAIRKFKPYTPGTRQRVVTDFSEITSAKPESCLLYTSPSPRDSMTSRMPSSA